ncbi:CHAD domain-containing protein [Methylobacillus arboreus]|uniref:CYTH and CHAD domain-containing protein n=1 Tax=Methylobacillus arboreus TaxID=755170 RepID=UPI001E628D63|nr:CYTH and CHAD domain-containing protein [Methylobacillus arboreus]MCB5189167.1 CHAD domain-containing protein [Methylobacillus arboreus]
MPNEIELKLRIAKADIPRLRRHASIRKHIAEKAITRRLVSTYYDTDDLQLFDQRVSLRVRRMSGGWFQAVKAAGHSLAGLHQRLEWEDIISRGEPDYTKITDPSLIPIFDQPALRQALRPIFTTDMRRTEWQLNYHGSHIELSLDDGLLIVGDKQQPLIEIELELKQGNIAHLFALALELQADIPLSIENVSKAQRGYAYYRDFTQAASKAKPAGLTSADSPSEAFEKIGWECLRHLQSNQAIAIQADDTEGVHQMRIALRRLKAALKTFAIQDDAIKEELSWLSDLLSKPRDLDVLLYETLPSLKLPADQIGQAQSHVERAKKRAYSKLRNGLKQARYQRLLLTLGHLFASGLQDNGSTLQKITDKQLRRTHSKLLKRGKRLTKLPAEKRHQVRIQARRLRYTLEFLSPVYPGKKTATQAEKLLSALRDAQTRLGSLNDIAVTSRTLAQMSKRTPGLQPAWLAWQQAAAKLEKRQRAALPASWKILLQAKTFW